MESTEVEQINDRCRYLDCYGISDIEADFRTAFGIVEEHYKGLELDERNRAFVDINKLFEEVRGMAAGKDLTRALRPSDIAQMVCTLAEMEGAAHHFICGVLVICFPNY